MRFSVQVEETGILKEAITSSCDKIRFGTEFCDVKIQPLSVLEEAYALAEEAGKDFAYVTPRVSESNIAKMYEQLEFLNEKGRIDVVLNDFGMLNVLRRYPNLTPHLGRQMIHVPARCPWLEPGLKEVVFHPLRIITRTKRLMSSSEDIYSQTSLNNSSTIRFFQGLGVQGVDLDWIPRCFPYYDFLTKNGLSLSVHLHLVPVTITRKCHTARFLGEKSPQSCSQLCKTKAFLLKREEFRLEFFLHGNAVFSLIEPSEKDIRSLLENDVSELVITMNPVTRILGRQELDTLIHQVETMAT